MTSCPNLHSCHGQLTTISSTVASCPNLHSCHGQLTTISSTVASCPNLHSCHCQLTTISSTVASCPDLHSCHGQLTTISSTVASCSHCLQWVYLTFSSDGDEQHHKPVMASQTITFLLCPSLIFLFLAYACTTRMKTIQGDLSSLDLQLHEARELARNRPLWRLMSLCSTTHSQWCMLLLDRIGSCHDYLLFSTAVDLHCDCF